MTKKTKSLREKLLTKKVIKPRELYLPDYDETIFIHAIKGADRTAFTDYAVTLKTEEQFRELWIALAAFDASGNRIFGLEDIPKIQDAWTPGDFSRAWQTAYEMNGVDVVLEKNG